MPIAELMEIARSGGYDALEARCLELLENGNLKLAHLVPPLEQLEQRGAGERIATLVQTIFENADPQSDPAAAVALARIALVAAPKSEELRKLTVELYRKIYGQVEGFDRLLEASGLAGARPPRMALKLLDFGLNLQPGDTLISRMDDRVVEVSNIDRINGLITLRREGRTTVMPAPEVVRDYDRIAADDFRVLRQLRPEQLTSLIAHDPLAVVVGLIHAHGEHIDADLLKHELVPKFIDPKSWSSWWTRARGLIKRAPNVQMQGRSPVILSYAANARTIEEETWQALQSQNDPIDWMTSIESYIREKTARKETPDADLLKRFNEHLLKYITAVKSRRPAEALTIALILQRIAERGVPVAPEDRELAVEMLRETPEPGMLLRAVEHDGLRELGLDALQKARPDDWIQHSLAWLPTAPAGLLEKIASAAIDAGHRDAVQVFIDDGLADLPRHPELMYWLWKGPKRRDVLNLPSDAELFRMILDMLSALGRTMTVETDVLKAFRHRAKAALSLRDYDRVAKVLAETSDAAAITVRRQLDRLEGLGENAPAKMLDLLRDAHPQLWAVRPPKLAPWQDPETVWTTTEGLSRRTAERDEILNVKMPENAKRIGEAASHGDLSENSEYKFALEERDLLRARLATINDDLSRARVLDPLEVQTESVCIGSRVKMRRLEDGAVQVMTFLGPFETDVDQGIYSYQAPVSQKLMGARLGDRIHLTLDGRDQQFDIIEISNGMLRT